MQADSAPAGRLMSFSFNTSSLPTPALHDGHRALSLIFSSPSKTVLLQLTPSGCSSLPGPGSLSRQQTAQHPPGHRRQKKMRSRGVLSQTHPVPHSAHAHTHHGPWGWTKRSLGGITLEHIDNTVSVRVFNSKEKQV